MEGFLASHWFWDIVIVIVLLLYMLIKGSKGFFDCIVPVIILAAAIVGSYIITPIIEPTVEAKLTPWVLSKVEKKINDTDLTSIIKGVTDKFLGGDSAEEKNTESAAESAADKIDFEELKKSIEGKSFEELTQSEQDFVNSLKTELPDTVKNLASQYGVDITQSIINNIDSLNITDSIKAQASTIAASVVTKVASKAIFTGCYVVVALALMLVLNIIKAIISPFLKEAPVLSQVNKTAGAIFGLIQGLLVIYIAVNIFRMFNLFNIGTIAEETFLLKFFLKISPAEIISMISGK